VIYSYPPLAPGFFYQNFFSQLSRIFFQSNFRKLFPMRRFWYELTGWSGVFLLFYLFWLLFGMGHEPGFVFGE
jgi:hypothetical protein